MRRAIPFFLFVFLLPVSVLKLSDLKWRVLHLSGVLSPEDAYSQPTTQISDPFFQKLVAAAFERTSHKVRYVADYKIIPYPNGDVPEDMGVCSDEIIRIYRTQGIDLQKAVHEDMVKHFKNYPQKWGLPGPDRNIDHRRVPNLLQYFKNKGALLPVSDKAADYKPGDLIAWDLGGGITHIGIMLDTQVPDSDRHYIMHNIGRGPEVEDFLFQAKIIGHVRYKGEASSPSN